MITTAQDYFALYHQVTSGNPPDLAVLLPSNDNIYEVNLDTRTITPPANLGVVGDEHAKIVFFKMDRYYDGFDLSNAIGVVEYINAKNEGFMYGIPFYDVETLNTVEPIYPNEAFEDDPYNKLHSSRQKMLFPWVISSDVTAAAGTVTFAMSFYVLDKDAEQLELEGKNASAKFVLRLNLRPTTSIVEPGLNSDANLAGLEDAVETPTILQLYAMYHTLLNDYSMYWDESADEMTINPNNSAVNYNSRVEEYRRKHQEKSYAEWLAEQENGQG